MYKDPVKERTIGPRSKVGEKPAAPKRSGKKKRANKSPAQKRPSRKPAAAQASKKALTGDTRTRVLTATRDLVVQEGFSALTVEKVAERAGVARLTIYYQFGSRQELLEKLLDYMAESGQLRTRLPQAFQKQDAIEALDEFIAAFCAFWSSDQGGLRRLRGWAHLEPAFEEQGRGRDAWRREGLQVLVTKLRAQYDVPAKSAVQDTIDVLHTLTSFETFDNLAHGGRTPASVELLLKRTARALLGLP